MIQILDKQHIIGDLIHLAIDCTGEMTGCDSPSPNGSRKAEGTVNSSEERALRG